MLWNWLKSRNPAYISLLIGLLLSAILFAVVLHLEGQKHEHNLRVSANERHLAIQTGFDRILSLLHGVTGLHVASHLVTPSEIADYLQTAHPQQLEVEAVMWIPRVAGSDRNAFEQTARRRGLPIDRLSLAQGWLDHIKMSPDEYGVCKRNMRHGLWPSLSGGYDNGFTAGMGAAIRSEIWACLAPGDPELAARLAREDACVDHADEGIYAETFFVTIESAGFLESDPRALIGKEVSDVVTVKVPAGVKELEILEISIE